MVDHQDYRARLEEDLVHRWGDGGERVKYVWLDKSNNPVLVSIYFSSWEVYSDDCGDNPRKKNTVTYLLAEDPLARAVFSSLEEKDQKQRFLPGLDHDF